MSEKKDINKEDLNSVTGGVNYGRQIDLDDFRQDYKTNEEPAETEFQPEDVSTK